MQAPEYIIYCALMSLLFFVLDVAIIYQLALALILIPGVIEVMNSP